MIDMPYVWILTIWFVIALAAIPYSAAIRNSQQRRLAAYLIFITIFTAAVFILSGLMDWVFAEWIPALSADRPLGLLVFLLLVFVPAFLLARWQTRKPPIRVLPP